MKSVLPMKQKMVDAKEDIPINQEVFESIKRVLVAGYGIDMLAGCSIYPENSYAINPENPPAHRTYVVTYMPSGYTDEAGGLDEKSLEMMDDGHEMVEYFDDIDEALVFYMRLDWVYKNQPPPQLKTKSAIISADEEDDDEEDAA